MSEFWRYKVSKKAHEKFDKINSRSQHWVALHADYLYAFAITRIGDEEQARDLVQETFLSALEGLDKFEQKSSERTWITAILKN